MERYKPVVLVVLDGWGYSPEKRGNAILNANLPTIKELDQYYPKIFLQASGLAVGLPWMQVGNSEVGHQVMGTGQIVFQNLPRISSSIGDGSFFKNKVLVDAITYAKKHGSNLHLLGLVSDGGVHSHLDHLSALLEMAKERRLSSNVFIHAITDGRDTLPGSAAEYLQKIIDSKTGRIASLCGRYYAMDRNNNWDRIQKEYNALVHGKGILKTDPLAALKEQYQGGVTDEYVKPVVIVDDNNQPVGKIQKNDVVIFFNFRKDRARQLTEAFVSPRFDKFPTSLEPQDIKFICLTQYDNKLKTEVAFPPQKIDYRISDILANKGLRQLKIAETEKYAHVSYFFNGGREKPYPKEYQLLIPSKNAPSYAEVPEMSAFEVTKTLISKIGEGIYDFVLLNYANPDMVGHTGNLEAGIKAVEVVDECLKKVMDAVIEEGGCLLITADHGNIEEMMNVRTGEMSTKHSINPVPCWFVTPSNRRKEPLDVPLKLKIEGMLVDIPPTILSLFGIKKPSQMRGIDLIEIFDKKQVATL